MGSSLIYQRVLNKVPVVNAFLIVLRSQFNSFAAFNILEYVAYSDPSISNKPIALPYSSRYLARNSFAL